MIDIRDHGGAFGGKQPFNLNKNKIPTASKDVIITSPLTPTYHLFPVYYNEDYIYSTYSPNSDTSIVYIYKHDAKTGELVKIISNVTGGIRYSVIGNLFLMFKSQENDNINIFNFDTETWSLSSSTVDTWIYQKIYNGEFSLDKTLVYLTGHDSAGRQFIKTFNAATGALVANSSNVSQGDYYYGVGVLRLNDRYLILSLSYGSGQKTKRVAIYDETTKTIVKTLDFTINGDEGWCGIMLDLRNPTTSFVFVYSQSIEFFTFDGTNITRTRTINFTTTHRVRQYFGDTMYMCWNTKYKFALIRINGMYALFDFESQQFKGYIPYPKSLPNLILNDKGAVGFSKEILKPDGTFGTGFVIYEF